MKRSAIPQLLLWLFVISAGLVSGGSVFERLVVTPLWAASPPESVTQWKYGGIQGAFFGLLTPLYGLFSLALAVATRWMPSRQRTWALVAGISGVITLIWTVLFFLPILQKTQVTAGAGLSGEEITRLVNQFQTWQWGRWALLFGGWLAGLRALSLSPDGD
jgi:hypothetical protein